MTSLQAGPNFCEQTLLDVKIANLLQLIWVRVWQTVFLHTFPAIWFASLHIRVNRIQFLEILGLK